MAKGKKPSSTAPAPPPAGAHIKGSSTVEVNAVVLRGSGQTSDPDEAQLLMAAAIKRRNETKAGKRPPVIEVRVHAPGRGPAVGTAAPNAESDRALFGDIREQLAKGSAWQACLNLAEAGRIVGAGTVDSRARRLLTRFNREGNKETR